MKQQFLAETAGTFQTYVYENNRKVVPSNALLTVFRPGGDDRLVDGAAMTIDPDGLLSYALSSAENANADVNYKAVVAYYHAGETNYATLFYDVVKSRLVKVITDDDITSELPQLKDNGYRVRGEAEGGTNATIIDPELKRYPDDYFTGGLAYSISKDETREVTAFVSSTGTVATTDFSSAIAANEKYILVRSYSKEIQRAFEKIEERIIRLGKRPELVLDPYDLREVHIYYSVAEVCKGLVTENENLWWELWKVYENKGEEAFAGINFKYDSSADGYIANSEEVTRVNVLRGARR